MKELLNDSKTCQLRSSRPSRCGWLSYILAAILLLFTLAACGSIDLPPATPTASQEGAPSSRGAASNEEATPAAEEVSPPAEGAAPADMSAEGVATAVSARTPIPTFTPGPIEIEIQDFAEERGIANQTFLGLTLVNWISTGFSILLIWAGYYVIPWLMVPLKWIIIRLWKEADDEFLRIVSRYIKWLLYLVLIRFALFRLTYLGDNFRTEVQDIYLLLGLFIGTLFALALIDFAATSYVERRVPDEDRRRLTPIVVTVTRFAQSIVLIVAASIVLNQIGFDVSIIAAIVLITGFLISFGARDILTDVVSGFIILTDQPFRIGDAILIKELDTWGTVLNIGTRSTQIRTGDNREVIIPNSRIGRSQVVNYTYPDSKFRVQTELGVAYGTDPEKMRSVTEEAVRNVDGVLTDRPIDIFFLKFDASTRLVRVRWWIDSYRNNNVMLDKVNTALELALNEAEIDLPFNTYDLNLNVGGDDLGTGIDE